MIAITFCWMPSTTGTTSVAPSVGSSPEMYSKVRPLRLTREMHAPGPSWMLVPFAQNSSPIATPHALARPGSQVAATFSVDGHCVDVPGGVVSP